MSEFRVTNSSAAVRQGPDRTAEARWFTTWDVARALHVTPEGVRHLVRAGKLRCEWTPKRRRLFLAFEVLALVEKRARARLSLVPCGLHKAARGVTRPRQLALFHLHIYSVSPDPKALGVRQAKDQRSRGVLFGS